MSGPLPLGEDATAALAGRVRLPAYDRRALVPAVVHLGVGRFHRAHQAAYLDDLAGAGGTGWGVTGVGFRSTAVRDALVAQDCLYTLVLRDAGGDDARVVGSLLRHLHAPDDPAAVVAALADPRTRLVTLTVTESGYAVGRPGPPTTPAGHLAAALDLRRRRGLPPFTVLSCDNAPDNGAMARAAVLGAARMRDERLAGWIERHGAFPSSMVDRITPRTDHALRRRVADRFGVLDRAPVVAEPFAQWVVEDAFSAGRPPLDRVGVQFVADARPHRLAKTRLLNGGHSALGHLGALAGHRTAHEVMADPDLAAYLAALMEREIAPLLPPVPGLDLDGYRCSLLRRLADPGIADPLARLCARGSAKVPAHLLPSLVQARRAGRSRALLVLAVAAWMRHLRGTDLRGAPLAVDDPLQEVLQPLARAGGDDPRPLLGERSVFGALGDDRELVAELGWALRQLSALGVTGTVRRHLDTAVAPAA